MAKSVSIFTLFLFCLFAILLFCWLVRIGHPESIPTVLISLLAAYFAFLAYVHTREKFRLDLYEKRYEIYSATLKFCSMVQKHADLAYRQDIAEDIAQAWEDAHNSFRGIGYHKTKFLFDEDIHKAFEELNSSFSTLVVKGDSSSHWINKKHEALLHVYELTKNLPGLFKPYMYFGDYKR